MPSEIFYLTEVPFQSLQRTAGLDYILVFPALITSVEQFVNYPPPTRIRKKGGVVLLLFHMEKRKCCVRLRL